MRPVESADVADIFQITGENHNREGAGHLLFAEIEEVNTIRSAFYSEDFSGYAFGFAHVLAGLVDGDAVGGREEWGGEQKDQRRSRSKSFSCDCGARCRALPGWTDESLP